MSLPDTEVKLQALRLVELTQDREQGKKKPRLNSRYQNILLGHSLKDF